MMIYRGRELFKTLEGTGCKASRINLFLENQMRSKVSAAKIWNLLTSFLGMASHSTKYRIARTQFEMGLVAKPEIIRGQEDVLQRIRAKSHSKKNMTQSFLGAFAKGTNPSINIHRSHKTTNATT
jgi:hypothetical protein